MPEPYNTIIAVVVGLALMVGVPGLALYAFGWALAHTYIGDDL